MAPPRKPQLFRRKPHRVRPTLAGLSNDFVRRRTRTPEVVGRSGSECFRHRARIFVRWCGPEFGRNIGWRIGGVTERVVRVQDALDQSGWDYSRPRDIENFIGHRLPSVGAGLV